jgi:hypothetical protein
MATNATDGSAAPAWALSDLPIVRQQMNLAKNVLTERFPQLSAHGDNRAYHALGVVAPADEEAVMGALEGIIEALDQYNRWSASEQPLTAQRYLQHCKEATDRAERLQDNKRALAECRRLLERHTGRSSRRKFLEQLEAIAHDANVAFFSLEVECLSRFACAYPGASAHKCLHSSDIIAYRNAFVCMLKDTCSCAISRALVNVKQQEQVC